MMGIMADQDDVRRIALSLPETSESESTLANRLTGAPVDDQLAAFA